MKIKTSTKSESFQEFANVKFSSPCYREFENWRLGTICSDDRVRVPEGKTWQTIPNHKLLT